MSRKVLNGFVVSAGKSEKTVVVKVERSVMHPLYKKYVKRSKRYAAHDAENRCQMGDKVSIRECRPFSKMKTWEVLSDANGVLS